ncbi:MAG: Mur ligase family protein [Anaeromyxobacteraceae bacterium]
MDPHRYLEALEPLSMRFGLDRMERALAALGRPDRAYPILHVAGTNGKGSTCAMSAAALAAAGHRVGLYTSPHLVAFEERIQVDGAPVGEGDLAALVDAVRAACPWHDAGGPGERLTYFEFATLLGLLHFARARCGAAVVEVGLGGRLDATNVVEPRVTAIARIGLDHQALLGGTFEAIAAEKAGIMKPGVPVVVHADQPPGALAVLRAEAARRAAPLEVAPADVAGAVALPGPHQRANAGLAAAAVRALARAGVPVDEAALARGLATARWPGRIETVGGVLLDGAHNPQGAAALAAALPVLHPGRPVELVLGVLADKDLAGMIDALAPAVRRVHAVAPPSPRARAAAEIAAAARARGLLAEEHPALGPALARARSLAGPGGQVCVAGSLYLVGEARALLAP